MKLRCRDGRIFSSLFINERFSVDKHARFYFKVGNSVGREICYENYIFCSVQVVANVKISNFILLSFVSHIDFILHLLSCQVAISPLQMSSQCNLVPVRSLTRLSGCLTDNYNNMQYKLTFQNFITILPTNINTAFLNTIERSS